MYAVQGCANCKQTPSPAAASTFVLYTRFTRSDLLICASAYAISDTRAAVLWQEFFHHASEILGINTTRRLKQ